MGMMGMALTTKWTGSITAGLVAAVSLLAVGSAPGQDWKGQGRLEGKPLRCGPPGGGRGPRCLNEG